MADNRKNNTLNITLLLLILGALCLGAAVVLYPVYLKRSKLRESNLKLHEELMAKEYKRAELNDKVSRLSSDPQMVEKVAREKFRLCGEGETILLYEEKEVTSTEK